MIGWLGEVLGRWVVLVVRHPGWVLLGLALITGVAGWIAIDRYAMNSRLGDLVQQDADWRSDYEAFQAAFPQLVETGLVVVSGTSFTQVETAAKQLEQAIAARSDQFVDVYAPANEPFFRDNALLFMSLAQLDEVSDTLARAQPMLSAVARDPSLRGVLRVVDSALAESVKAPGTFANSGFDDVLVRLTRSAEAALAGDDATIRWGDEFLGGSDSVHYRIIFLRGKQNYGSSLPNAQLVSSLQDIIAATPVGPDVRVNLTGEIALRHEEVQAAVGGVQLAGGFAILLLGAVLAFGVRSARVVLGTFVMLLVGVVWTSAWAMLAVGSYNTLSLVFLVMFFGLGVDFCVHYCLRLQEALDSSRTADMPTDQAAIQGAFSAATRSVGGPIALCTLTTTIGFLGFAPTPYKGLADLGVISAGGMAIACVLTFTLLPALFTQFGVPAGRTIVLPGGAQIMTVLLRWRVGVLALLGLLFACCLYLLPRLEFDYSVLALRDPAAESMQTLRELQREKQITDYALYALAPADELDTYKSLVSLDSVERVTTPLDYVPREQEEKLYALEDLDAMLGSALVPLESADAAGVNVEQLRVAVDNSATGIANALATGHLDPKRKALVRALHKQLLSMGSTAASGPNANAESSNRALLAWQSGVVDGLLPELDWLRRAIGAAQVEFADLPAGLRARLVAPDGRYLSAIVPAKDITPVAALSEFIASVRSELPTATGRPVVEWGVGGIVVESFKTALVVALVGIALVLLLMLRSLRNALLVLTPLALTGLFTAATIVLLDVPLNMASVLVLPLIFGLGVDNGIHIVERYKDFALGAQASDLMRSSTPRAVLLSTLTTVGTFAALMLSPHAGTASIGFLLTIAVIWLLVFTCFVLPLLLSLGVNRTDVLTS